jgi:hypothetical protein
MPGPLQVIAVSFSPGSGSGVTTSSGRLQLILTEMRPLPRGRYTLTLRGSQGRRSITRRVEITIG